jgi:hypothetical protein
VLLCVDSNGRGVMILPDGAVYDGEYVQGAPHGFGRFEAGEQQRKRRVVS